MGGCQLNSKAYLASAQPTATATSEATKPASKPTPASSMRCTLRSSWDPAPTARSTANSRSRSPRVAVMVASSTTSPAASAKPNRNSTALITWPSTRCTWAMVWLMSTLVMLGNWRTRALSNCALPWGARKALM